MAVSSVLALPLFLENLIGNQYKSLGICIPIVLLFVQYYSLYNFKINLFFSIIPQALFRRYSLRLTYYLRWYFFILYIFICLIELCNRVLWTFIILLGIVAWPISKILDLAVGTDDDLLFDRKGFFT